MSPLGLQGCILLVSVLCKLLVMPSYFSTDFEVHRNWLAITHSTPLHQWYLDASTSIWTLDYPPYFAYFEFLLSYLAVQVDPQIVNITALNYKANSCILFQRISVITMDSIYQIFTYLYLQHHPYSLQLLFLIAFNPCLLIVDHIHFQYNGFLIGILIACFYFAKSHKYILLAHAFCILILLKHLFLPLVPIFAIYLLKLYCKFTIESNHIHINIQKFLTLISIALLHLVFAFGPFVLQSNPSQQISAIFARLFPFQRGLTHAYWAPNVWAIYSFIDYLGNYSYRKFNGLDYTSPGYVSGLVGNYSFTWLPNISPLTSLILVIIAILPALIRIYRFPTFLNLIEGTMHCTLSAFMLGYHVHEKAILAPIICAVLLSFESNESSMLFMHMSVPAIFSLFPLLIRRTDIITKVTFSLSYLILQRLLLNPKVSHSHLRYFI